MIKNLLFYLQYWFTIYITIILNLIDLNFNYNNEVNGNMKIL